MKKPPQYFQQGITTPDLLNFFRQLSTLISAGLSLMKSLDIIRQANDKPAFRALIQRLRLDLESGQEFSHCLRRHPRCFDLFSCQLIHLGEQTGTLDLILKRITLHKEKSLALNKQLLQALIYPGTLLIVALISSLFLLLYVVPQFAILFEHFPDKIPAPTQALIRLSFFMKKLAPGIGLLSLISFLSFFHLRPSLRLSQHCQRLAFQLPYLSQLSLKIVLAKFSRSLATILTAGLPLTEGLKLTSQLALGDELKKSIQTLETGVNSGKGLSFCLELNPLFPPLLIHLSKTGEESGTLDLMLEKFAEIYEADLEHFLSTAKLLLEPLIIAILGVLIGGVVIIMYLPIFRLGTAI